MPLFVRSTLCVTPLVCTMWVVAPAGLPNSWPSWLWIRQLSDPLLSDWPFLTLKKLVCFFHFLFSLYQIHFSKKKNWRKVIFWMLPIPTKISFWTVVILNIMQFSVDISVMDTEKYRKLVLTGEIWRPWRGQPGLERIHVEVLKLPIFRCIYRPSRPRQGFEPSGTTGPHWRFSDPNVIVPFHLKVVTNLFHLYVWV